MRRNFQMSDRIFAAFILSGSDESFAPSVTCQLFKGYRVIIRENTVLFSATISHLGRGERRRVMHNGWKTQQQAFQRWRKSLATPKHV